MLRVYLDTEYCYPGMKRGQPRPTSADMRQIVQIAAIIFDTKNGKEIQSFNTLVIPKFEEQVSSFFQELTGITQADIDREGIKFAQALRSFAAFCDELPVWTFDRDEEVLQQNCGYEDIQWPFQQSFVRVKGLLSSWGIDPDAYSSGTLYKAANLQLDGHVHNALHDVRSMAQSVHSFEHRVL